jgi:hypothetical protein
LEEFLELRRGGFFAVGRYLSGRANWAREETQRGAFFEAGGKAA